MVQIRQFARIYERNIPYASGHWDQLFIVGDDRIRFPILDTAAPFQGTAITIVMESRANVITVVESI